MIANLRQSFNRQYTDSAYQHLLQDMEQRTRTKLEIRIAETPVFLPGDLVQKMIDAGAAMTQQLVQNADYLKSAGKTIPAAFRVAAQDAHPHFMTVDFGLIHTGDGPWQGDPATLEPRLVELQAFPSVYGYQAVLGDLYRRHFRLPEFLRSYPAGLNEETYWAKLKSVIVGEHDPKNVILLEVTPTLQKTLPDFRIHEDRLGIRAVDISSVHHQHGRLFYVRDGIRTPVERIYNRSIVDEMVRKSVHPGFDLTSDLNVEWAGNPNWYFLISKFALPYLNHPFAPPAVFLSDWMNGKGRERLSNDRSQWVLKPLFSFAGRGIEFGPSDETLQGIPTTERSHYLLQQRVSFQPTIATPYGPTQAEIRILYVWPDGENLQEVQTLVRLGRGVMMGVDHNRNQLWVGGSAGFIF